MHVEQFTETSFSVDVDKYDVKKVEVSVKQLVYADGEMVVPKEPKVVEYEVEVLTPEGSSENQFEKIITLSMISAVVLAIVIGVSYKVTII